MNRRLLLLIVCALVVCPVSWAQDSAKAIQHPTHPRIQQFEGLSKAYRMASTLKDSGLPFYAPLNTRLQIHWLDSVAVVKCLSVRNTMLDSVSLMHGDSLQFIGDTLWYAEPVPGPDGEGYYWVRFTAYTTACDTLSWRMTACSLSVKEAGE